MSSWETEFHKMVFLNWSGGRLFSCPRDEIRIRLETIQWVVVASRVTLHINALHPPPYHTCACFTLKKEVIQIKYLKVWVLTVDISQAKK